MDKKTYDRPEDEGSKQGRGVMLLLGAAVLVLIFWAIYNGHVPFG